MRDSSNAFRFFHLAVIILLASPAWAEEGSFHGPQLPRQKLLERILIPPAPHVPASLHPTWWTLTPNERFTHNYHPGIASEVASSTGRIDYDSVAFSDAVQKRLPVDRKGYLDGLRTAVVEDAELRMTDGIKHYAKSSLANAVKGMLRADMGDLSSLTGVEGSRLDTALKAYTDAWVDEAADHVESHLSGLPTEPDVVLDEIAGAHAGILENLQGKPGKLGGLIGRLLDELFADMERVLDGWKPDFETALATNPDYGSVADRDESASSLDLDAAVGSLSGRLNAGLDSRRVERIGRLADDALAARETLRDETAENEAVRERAKRLNAESIFAVGSQSAHLGAEVAKGRGPESPNAPTGMGGRIQATSATPEQLREAYPDGLAYEVQTNQGSHWEKCVGLDKSSAMQLVESGKWATASFDEHKNKLRSYPARSPMKIKCETIPTP